MSSDRGGARAPAARALLTIYITVKVLTIHVLTISYQLYIYNY